MPIVSKSDDKSEIVITNKSRQMLSLQVKPPNGDFYYEEYQIRIMPGKSTKIPRRYLNWSQIENCRGKGMISISESKN